MGILLRLWEDAMCTKVFRDRVCRCSGTVGAGVQGPSVQLCMPATASWLSGGALLPSVLTTARQAVAGAGLL